MNYPVTLDIHTHTIASGHAYGTIREMAYAASQKKLSLLGFSEHAPGIPGTADPIYFMNLSAVPRTLYGVKILHGSEVNILNDGSISLEKRYLDRLDYAIAGIHDFCYQDAGVQKNTENVISCMKKEKVCFISHPDDGRTPLDYEALAQAARTYHVALEVNNNSIRKKERRLHCIQNYKTMLSFCMRYQTPVLLSSDAHDPSQVGDVSLAEELLHQVSFDPALVLNADADRLLDFISFDRRF